MLLVDGRGMPLAVNLHAANHAEVHLIQPLLDEHQLEQYAPRLIDDRATDSNKLRDELAADGIRLITPHRRGRKDIHSVARLPRAETIPATVESRANVRLAGQLPATRHPRRAQPLALPRLRHARLPPPTVAQALSVMKLLLGGLARM
jgi:hypothetical protein